MAQVSARHEPVHALLRTHVEANAPSTEGTTAGSVSLPADLKDKACRRLAQFGLMMAVLVTFVALASPGLWGDLPFSKKLILGVTQAVAIALSLAVGLLARWSRLSAAFKLHLGLAYVVLFCLVYSVGYTWFTTAAYNIFAAMTLATLVIAIYPLIVPGPPRQVLVVSLLAAATAPLSMAVVVAMGLAEHSTADYLGVSIYPAICVVLAQFGSRVVHGLRADVLRARELGSYRLEERLGSGGMGEVWRAHHRLLARPAAVKLIHREPTGTDTDGRDTLTERFKREAKATAMLESPHTVSVFDFGITDDHTFYLAMELVDGVNLETLVSESGPLPAARVVFLAEQVCHSLAEAHVHGLIHRDIKPANIMVCADRAGDADFVKVLDFGLVAIRSCEVGPSDARLTADNRIVGTPAYMAPELFERPVVDGSADLYALGCTLYWLLTGRRVFEGNSALELAVAHFQCDPDPPSDFADGVPRELDELVLSLLAKDPGERPEGAGEVVARLRACGLSEEWSQDDARRWWSERGAGIAPRRADAGDGTMTDA